MRDFNAFLRYATADEASTPNPLAGDVTRIYTEAVSQPARMLNDFRNLGFNRAENGRIVFDGMLQWIAAGNGINMNYRFSQPGRTETVIIEFADFQCPFCAEHLRHRCWAWGMRTGAWSEAAGKFPFVIGSTQIIPRANLRFRKTEEMGIIFQVYGASLNDRFPNLTVEYLFSKRSGSGVTPFNKTEPQHFNQRTLPPSFDVARGHQIVAGQMIPLAPFAPGDYQVDISITDNLNRAVIRRQVMFAVTP